MSRRYGAAPEAWDHYVALGLTADLLPVVSNPRAAISPNSKMRALGKTPSVYNSRRHVAGFPEWTSYRATPADITNWKREPDYGICIQTRRCRAIDIDVPDREKAQRIVDAVQRWMGAAAPMRFRADSGKVLIPFEFEPSMPKRVIPVDGGMIEFLGDGQQFIAEGTHPAGERYEWQGSIGGAIPFDAERLEEMWRMLVAILSIGKPMIAREKRSMGNPIDLIVHDPAADWLVANWETYDVGDVGQVFIECPFSEEHTSDSGPTSTAYFPAGTGGYERGHFVCLHAHCNGRVDADFLDATGFSVAQFDDLTSGVVEDIDRAASTPVEEAVARNVAEQCGLEPWPPLVRDSGGRPEATADNLVKMIGRSDVVYRQIAYDDFKDEIIWAPHGEDPPQWRSFGDADVTDVRIQLERRRFKPMGRELLRDAIHMVALQNRLDTASTWLNRLRWDGVPRVERFTALCWGWEPSPYAEAVGRYVWTALAGRVLQPGVRADMAPILVGEQGLKKTSALQLMAPNEDFYCEIKLDAKEDDLARLMRGKLVGELEELRGLHSNRAIEDIKAYITRRYENWVPKFKEFATRYARRLVFFGSTNNDEILGDPTGERRWLPGRCAFIDLDLIREWREQLWAEGAVRFAMDGVDWEDAERLAPAEHHAFKVSDSWDRLVMMWLDAESLDKVKPLDKGYVEIGEVLSLAIGVPAPQQEKRHEMRVGPILKRLGLVRRRRTTVDGRADQWVYMRDPDKVL